MSNEQFDDKLKLLVLKGEISFEQIKASLLLLADEETKQLVEQIEKYGNYNGPKPFRRILPFPYLSSKQYTQFFKAFADDPDQLKFFINDVLDRQADLNIHYITQEQFGPLKQLAGDLGNSAFVINHYVSCIPASKRDRCKDELLEIKQAVENIKNKLIPILDELEESLEDI